MPRHNEDRQLAHAGQDIHLRHCPLSWTIFMYSLFWPCPGSDTLPPPAQEGSPSRAVCTQAIPPSSGVIWTQTQFSLCTLQLPWVWRWGSRSGESPEDNPWTKWFSDTSKLYLGLEGWLRPRTGRKKGKSVPDERVSGEGLGSLGDRLAGRERLAQVLSPRGPQLDMALPGLRQVWLRIRPGAVPAAGATPRTHTASSSITSMAAPGYEQASLLSQPCSFHY